MISYKYPVSSLKFPVGIIIQCTELFHTDKYEGVTNTIFHTCPVLYQYEAGNDCQCRKSHGGENYKVSDSTSISLDSETYQNSNNIYIDLMNYNSFISLVDFLSLLKGSKKYRSRHVLLTSCQNLFQ